MIFKGRASGVDDTDGALPRSSLLVTAPSPAVVIHAYGVQPPPISISRTFSSLKSNPVDSKSHS